MMGGASRSVSEARVVVGLDFGTTYSGYAYAHKSDPSEIYTFYEWPGAHKPYCKTITGIYYKPAAAAAAAAADGGDSLVNPSWGYKARTEYEKDSAAARRLLRRSVSDIDEMWATRLLQTFHRASLPTTSSQTTCDRLGGIS